MKNISKIIKIKKHNLEIFPKLHSIHAHTMLKSFEHFIETFQKALLAGNTSGDQFDNVFKKRGGLKEEVLRPTNLFADFYRTSKDDGLVSRFEEERLNKLRNFKFFSNNTHLDDSINFHKLKKAHSLYTSQLEKSKKWLSLMCILERFYIQLDSYQNPRMSFRLYKQKSGDNIFHYIVIRAPFYDLKKGNIEVRAYHNKIEDYPDCKTINDVIRKNQGYFIEATDIIRKAMKKHMTPAHLLIDEMEQEFKKL